MGTVIDNSYGIYTSINSCAIVFWIFIKNAVEEATVADNVEENEIRESMLKINESINSMEKVRFLYSLSNFKQSNHYYVKALKFWFWSDKNWVRRTFPVFNSESFV